MDVSEDLRNFHVYKFFTKKNLHKNCGDSEAQHRQWAEQIVHVLVHQHEEKKNAPRLGYVRGNWWKMQLTREEIVELLRQR